MCFRWCISLDLSEIPKETRKQRSPLVLQSYLHWLVENLANWDVETTSLFSSTLRKFSHINHDEAKSVGVCKVRRPSWRHQKRTVKSPPESMRIPGQTAHQNTTGTPHLQHDPGITQWYGFDLETPAGHQIRRTTPVWLWYMSAV